MRSAPAPLPDLGTGPAPRPGRPVGLGPGLARVTAANPGLMTGPGTNTYLVGGPDVAVVDPGPDDPAHRRAVLDAVAAAGGTVRWVLVTHTHPDHAPGAAPLAAASGAQQVGFGARDGFVPDRSVGDGWVLEGAGLRLRAVHTPGHAADHLCWLLEGPQVLLSGDHVMQGSTVVIKPPDGDMAAYLGSLDRLLALDPPLSAIAPGHGRVIDRPAPAVRALVAHRLDRERAVAGALAAAGRATVDGLLPTVYADVDAERRAVARYSLWAHLRKLAGEGRAATTAAPGGAGTAEELWSAWMATPTTVGPPEVRLTATGGPDGPDGG